MHNGFTQPLSESIFSFPAPNWLRKPRRLGSIQTRDKSFPISLDKVVTQFSSCRVQESDLSNDVKISTCSGKTAEKQTNTQNSLSGRIIKSLPRRRPTKHISLPEGTSTRPEPRPLPRRASSNANWAMSEPSDTESATSATSLLSDQTGTTSLPLQVGAAPILVETHSPFEKVLSWRKNNYF